MNLLYRILKHLATLLFIVLPLELIGIIILYPVLLFVPRESQELPKYLRWFQNGTHDGLDGYYKFRENHGLNDPNLPHYKRAYWRYVWIAWRNPLNYFQYNVLGVVVPPEMNRVQVHEETNALGKVGNFDHPGYRYTRVWIDGKEYWELYFIKPYAILGRRLCVRLRIGHKFGDDVDTGYTQWVLTFNPVHPYEGV